MEREAADEVVFTTTKCKSWCLRITQYELVRAVRIVSIFSLILIPQNSNRTTDIYSATTSTKRMQAAEEGSDKSEKAKTTTPTQRLKAALEDLPPVADESPNEAPNDNVSTMEIAARSMMDVHHSFTRLQILCAQNKIATLRESKEPTESRLNTVQTKKRTKLRLLSLDNNLLSNIMDFMDEEGLLAVSEASDILNQRGIRLEHWQKLEQKRAITGLPLADDAREIGIAFAKAAPFARHMEHLAAEHYESGHPDTDNRSPECEGCHEFPSTLFTVDPSANYKFFFRFSYRNSGDLIWEGFNPDHFYESGRGYHVFGLSLLLFHGITWPEVDSIREWLAMQTGDRGVSLAALESKFVEFLDNLRVTIVAFDPANLEQPYLVVATAGYWTAHLPRLLRGPQACLQPRPQNTHAQNTHERYPDRYCVALIEISRRSFSLSIWMGTPSEIDVLACRFQRGHLSRAMFGLSDQRYYDSDD